MLFDDMAVAMENPSDLTDELGKRFTLKSGNVEKPDLHLGTTRLNSLLLSLMIRERCHWLCLV